MWEDEVVGPSFPALLIEETCWGKKKKKDNSADRNLWGCENWEACRLQVLITA